MLEWFQMVNYKPAKTPLDSSLPLRNAAATDKRTDQKLYQELTETLNRAAVFSRPDIALLFPSHLSSIQIPLKLI
jgi:hypothetical protein